MNGSQGFPNPNNETLQLDTTIEGTHKLVQPCLAIAVNHKSVATATSPLPSDEVPNASQRGTKSEVAHNWAFGET